jgi:cell division protein ZapA (FtsZ GTPase activity inhibitor)
MSKSIKVIIGGKEYSLKGDDENVIQLAAADVNRQLESLSDRHKGESLTTLAILTALNIAEKHYRLKQDIEVDKNKVISDMNEMSSMLSEFLGTES